jgi:hypothetical protein
MRPLALLLALLAAAGTTACATAAPSPAPSPDRILVVDRDGTVVRQSTADENARAVIAAPLAQVWPAILLAYSDLGIEPTVSDRAAGRYGNAGFVAPRRIMGRPLGEFFHCGSGMTGPLIDMGRLYANVVSALADDGAGGTVVVTHVSGTLRRNDGTSTDPINCSSTGALEEYIRQSTQKRVTAH